MKWSEEYNTRVSASMNLQRRLVSRQVIYPLTAVVVALLLWQGAAMIIGNKFILPGVTDVLAESVDLIWGPDGTLIPDIGVSLYHFAIGIGASLVVGIPVGILIGWYKSWDIALNPIIEILRPIPPLAWIPFAIIWFGLTHFAAGFIIFVGSVFPILVNTYTGFKNVPKVFVEAARVLGCTQNSRLIRKVALPSAFPSIIAGIRISMGVGWMCLVGAEIFGAGSGKLGLGKNLWTYYNLHNMPAVVVYMIVLGLIGLGMDMGLRWYVNREMLKWHEEEM